MLFPADDLTDPQLKASFSSLCLESVPPPSFPNFSNGWRQALRPAVIGPTGAASHVGFHVDSMFGMRTWTIDLCVGSAIFANPLLPLRVSSSLRSDQMSDSLILDCRTSSQSEQLGNLLQGMLASDPDQRLTTEQVNAHEYFPNGFAEQARDSASCLQ